jgi:hypothetical protein
MGVSENLSVFWIHDFNYGNLSCQRLYNNSKVLFRHCNLYLLSIFSIALLYIFPWVIIKMYEILRLLSDALCTII